MPRDANGDVTLPAGNPVVADTEITASWGNTTMADMATMMQDSLSRSGKGGMLVPFRHQDGTVAAPGITFTNQTGTGFYRTATGIFVAIVGVLKVMFEATLATFKTDVKVEGDVEVTGAVAVNGVTATTTYDYAAAKTEVKILGVDSATVSSATSTFSPPDSSRPATVVNGAGATIVLSWAWSLPRGSTAKSFAVQHFNNSAGGVAPTIVVRHYAKTATTWTQTLLYNATLSNTAAGTEGWRDADITDKVMAEGDILITEVTIGSSAAADQFVSGAALTYETSAVANVT